ncbi:hypothetical protein PAMC26577_38870 [Caballeronia sordidicola]|uniref:Uncharacterized protein n=1 Tax=Caballeronia sordidicola TaxID=196367 RepID=A0A242M3M5_CABSO|nr:hypothetical protein PAMC26577_38870 [Caballeronia sordidicola]
MFDSRNRAMRRLNIETAIRLNNLQTIWMYAVHHHVQVEIGGIGMKSVNGLMIFQSHFF